MKMKKKIFGNNDDIQKLNKTNHFCAGNYSTTYDKSFILKRLELTAHSD